MKNSNKMCFSDFTRFQIVNTILKILKLVWTRHFERRPKILNVRLNQFRILECKNYDFDLIWNGRLTQLIVNAHEIVWLFIVILNYLIQFVPLPTCSCVINSHHGFWKISTTTNRFTKEFQPFSWLRKRAKLNEEAIDNNLY